MSSRRSPTSTSDLLPYHTTSQTHLYSHIALAMSSLVVLSYHPSELVQRSRHTAVWPLQSSARIIVSEHGSNHPEFPVESLMQAGRHSPPPQVQWWLSIMPQE
jgi:hypothetical protein